MGHNYHNYRNNMRNVTSRKNLPAFSLVELMVTIGVIGIISAIAIPSISNMWSIARESSSRRNAQQAASLSHIADSAGLDHVVPESSGGIKATLELLSAGISGLSTTGIPIQVQLPLTEDEINKAAKYLVLRTSATKVNLEYDPKY